MEKVSLSKCTPDAEDDPVEDSAEAPSALGPGPCAGVGGAAGCGLKDSQRGSSLSPCSTAHLGWMRARGWSRELSGSFVSEPRALQISPPPGKQFWVQGSRRFWNPPG